MRVSCWPRLMFQNGRFARDEWSLRSPFEAKCGITITGVLAKSNFCSHYENRISLSGIHPSILFFLFHHPHSLLGFHWRYACVRKKGRLEYPFVLTWHTRKFEFNGCVLLEMKYCMSISCVACLLRATKLIYLYRCNKDGSAEMNVTTHLCMMSQS